MDPGTQVSGVHWSIFTGDAFKVAKLLVKFKFTEESENSIVVDDLNCEE